MRRLEPALTGSFGFQKATMLSRVSPVVGGSIKLMAPSPKAVVGSTHRLGRRLYQSTVSWYDLKSWSVCSGPKPRGLLSMYTLN